MAPTEQTAFRIIAPGPVGTTIGRNQRRTAGYTLGTVLRTNRSFVVENSIVFGKNDAAEKAGNRTILPRDASTEVLV